jgi:hypothetical protein
VRHGDARRLAVFATRGLRGGEVREREETRDEYLDREEQHEREQDAREIAFLRAEVERLRNDRDFYRENSAALGHALEIGNAKIEGLRALLLEVAEGGVEFDDPRVRYVAVQIDADTWARVKALTAPAEEGK